MFLVSFAEKKWADLSFLGTREEIAFVSKWAVSQNENKSKGNHSGLSLSFSSFVWKLALLFGDELLQLAKHFCSEEQ